PGRRPDVAVGVGGARVDDIVLELGGLAAGGLDADLDAVGLGGDQRLGAAPGGGGLAGPGVRAALGLEEAPVRPRARGGITGADEGLDVGPVARPGHARDAEVLG